MTLIAGDDQNQPRPATLRIVTITAASSTIHKDQVPTSRSTTGVVKDLAREEREQVNPGHGHQSPRPAAIALNDGRSSSARSAAFQSTRGTLAVRECAARCIGLDRGHDHLVTNLNSQACGVNSRCARGRGGLGSVDAEV